MICMYLTGIAVGIIFALISKSVFFKGNPIPFVMELPNYRLPSLKSTLMLMWDKARDFLHRAFTVIFIASIVIWFLQTFDTRLNIVQDNSQSLLAVIGGVIAPIFAPAGFSDWRISTSLITGFMAKEAVISTMGVLLGSAQLSSVFTCVSAVSFLVFCLLYTPCVAAVAAIRREMGSTVKTVGIVILQCLVAWIWAVIVFQIGSLLV